MAKARWIEVTLTVEAELAEAVAEVLARFVVNGVAVEQEVIYNDAEEVSAQAGAIRVYGYFSTTHHAAEKRKQIEEALWHLSQIQPLPEPTFRILPDEDWMSVWKQHYHPIPVGERLLVLPAWVEQGDPGRICVHIDPSMAFGTGTHPSTQLCMELLDKHVRPDQPVIDIGCGSGILSIAALKLGASQALAVDIDQEALHATAENAARNGVLARLEIGKGSVQEILNMRFPIVHAPVVVANILASVIIGLFNDGLARLVERYGVLILAGILETQAEEVALTACSHGMELVERRSRGDWVALVFRRV